MKLKLYSLLFPKAETTPVPELYYHYLVNPMRKIYYRPNSSSLVFDSGAFANFDTYFNSFSLEKWIKYTSLDNLRLELKLSGEFLVKICRYQLAYREVTIEDLLICEKKAEGVSSFSFDIPLDNTKGIIAFSLEALSDKAALHGGAYYTEVSADALNEVNIAIAMCTYHREAYFSRNISLLNNNIFESSDSSLNGHLELYAADNGQTLPVEKLESRYVHIFPQNSYGGSGGFVRCVIEILNNADTKHHTHILFMDDDVVIEPEGLIRTYSLLQLLRPEYKNRQVGGAMLRTDIRFIQYESSGEFLGYGVRSVKGNRDLRDLFWVLDNEKEEYRNYQAWFYSCVPISVYLKLGFSLPFYMRSDDVEYGLRQKPSITLNGVCVWHEPFEGKANNVSKYFSLRNELIVASIHGSASKKRILKELLHATKWHLLCYQYKELKAYIRAVNDFLNGVDWLETIDARSLYSELVQDDYTREPIDKLDVHFSYEKLYFSLDVQERRFKKWLRRLSLNGLILPATHDAVVSMTRCRIINFYRARCVLFYDDFSGKGYISTKSYREFFCGIISCLKTILRVMARFDSVANEYRERKEELSQRERWERYLDL